MTGCQACGKAQQVSQDAGDLQQQVRDVEQRAQQGRDEIASAQEKALAIKKPEGIVQKLVSTLSTVASAIDLSGAQGFSGTVETGRALNVDRYGLAVGQTTTPEGLHRLHLEYDRCYLQLSVAQRKVVSDLANVADGKPYSELSDQEVKDLPPGENPLLFGCVGKKLSGLEP